MSHSLVEISYSDWPKLLHLFNERKTCSSAYGLILNYITWIKKDPEIPAKIYALDGDWENDGTFILIDCEVEFPKVFFNTLSSNTERLSRALACLDTNQPIQMFAFQERFLPVLNHNLIQNGYDLNYIQCDKTIWLYIEREKALAFDINPPEGIYLSQLDVKQACTINDVWPHRSAGSIKFVERLIKSNESVGAFDKDGNLIAWCLRLPVGALGLLQVAESHKRQGLGSLVVRNLSHVIASKGEEILAPVVVMNFASRAMFEKLGFHEIDNVYWALRPAK